jgi:hypothetical protein
MAVGDPGHNAVLAVEAVTLGKSTGVAVNSGPGDVPCLVILQHLNNVNKRKRKEELSRI